MKWCTPEVGMFVRWKLSDGREESGTIVSVCDNMFRTDTGHRVHCSMWKVVEACDPPVDVRRYAHGTRVRHTQPIALNRTELVGTIEIDNHGRHWVNWDNDVPWRLRWAKCALHVLEPLDACGVFLPCEVEAAKVHGSARYQEAAADCDQLRMLKMELDYQEEQERYRMDNAELLGWMTDADINESCDADERLLDEDIEERKAALRRAATPVLPFETFGDWRERHGFCYVGEWMRALYVECGGTLRPEHVQL